MDGLPLARIRNLDVARQRFGHRVDTFLGGLTRMDPPADEALASMGERRALEELTRIASRTPLGFERRALERGGELIHRTGIFSIVALAAGALPQTYASAAGNKPLIMSGRLERQAYRRLHETARFLLAVCAPNSMNAPDGTGFKTCLRVRLVHARVRQMILRSGRWRADLWGEPANQHDLLGTLLAFTALMLEGLERLGLQIPEPEAELYLQLFRYAGFVLGIEEGLLPTCLAEARQLVEMYRMTETLPDEDSRALAQALFEAPLREANSRGESALAHLMRHLLVSGSRELLPQELLEAFAAPPAPWLPTLKLARPAARLLEAAGRTPLLRPGVVWAGRTFWERFVDLGMHGEAYNFPLPERLAGKNIVEIQT